MNLLQILENSDIWSPVVNERNSYQTALWKELSFERILGGGRVWSGRTVVYEKFQEF